MCVHITTMKQSLLPLLLAIALTSCRKQDDTVEVNYQYVHINQLSINQFPQMNGSLHWDNNWGDPFDPDLYFMVKNQDGFIYYSSGVSYEMEQSDLPLNYNYLYLNPLPFYRDQLIIELYDADSGDDQLLGKVAFYPFEVSAEDGIAYVRETSGQISIAATLQFIE